MIETQGIILKIHVINFSMYMLHQISDEFKVQKQPSLCLCVYACFILIWSKIALYRDIV